LPSEIGQLSALETLYVNNKQLTALPSEIGQLTTLKELYLNENLLTALPSEIGQLTGLEWIYIRTNQLSHIPLEIVLHPHIKNVAYEGNPLAYPPESIQKEGWAAVREYLQQPDPHLITRAFWMTVIAAPVTLVVGAWGLIRVWARRADRHPRIVMTESPGRG
jgi:Leucine-rich repeat (LRR) protein